MINQTTYKKSSRQLHAISTVVLIATAFFGLTASTIIQPEGNTFLNTTWTLSQIIKFNGEGKKPEIQKADSSCGTTLYFDSNGTYKGFSGWNDFSGKYSIIVDSIMIHDDISYIITMDPPIRTKRAGDPKCKLGETVCDYFSKVKGAFVQDNELSIGLDSITIVFNKQNP